MCNKERIGTQEMKKVRLKNQLLRFDKTQLRIASSNLGLFKETLVHIRFFFCMFYY
jgi:hypothetical protein